MKTQPYTTIPAIIALMLFSGVGALAQPEHQHDADKPLQQDMSKMDMSSMMNEPHHALAMAYMQNIGTFAKTLHNQAELKPEYANQKFLTIVAVNKLSLEVQNVENCSRSV